MFCLNNYLRNDVMIGREILNQGFVMNMTATKLCLTKTFCVNGINNDNTLEPNITAIVTNIEG